MTDAAATDMSGDSRQGIQSVEIGTKVLFSLAQAGAPLTLNELARLCGEAPNKVHRYLVSLGRVGLTSQSPATGRYDLGPSLRQLGAEALRRTNEIAVASTYAARLRDETGYAVNVGAWTDSGPVIVRWEYGIHALAMTTRIGAVIPLIESAAGQVFLAHLPQRMTRPALEIQYGHLDEALEQKIQQTVERVRADGYGRSDGAVVSAHLSLSIPISAASDPMPVVLTLVMPRQRVGEDERSSALDALRKSVHDAVMELGGPPEGPTAE